MKLMKSIFKVALLIIGFIISLPIGILIIIAVLINPALAPKLTSMTHRIKEKARTKEFEKSIRQVKKEDTGEVQRINRETQIHNN